MSAFQQAKNVEEIACQHILPWLAANCERVEPTDSSEFLQRHWGDFVQVLRDGTVRSIELKAEARDAYGNFFLETWSNRCAPFWTLGWLYTCKSDWLFYYFVEERRLYVLDMRRLRLWAFGDGVTQAEGNLYRYPEKLQGKYGQKNATWGRCVPIVDLLKFEWVAAYEYTGKLTFQKMEKTNLTRMPLKAAA